MKDILKAASYKSSSGCHRVAGGPAGPHQSCAINTESFLLLSTRTRWDAGENLNKEKVEAVKPRWSAQIRLKCEMTGQRRNDKKEEKQQKKDVFLGDFNNTNGCLQEEKHHFDASARVRAWEGRKRSSKRTARTSLMQKDKCSASLRPPLNP